MILQFEDFLLEKEKTGKDKVAVFDFDDTLATSRDLVGILRLRDGKPVEEIKEDLLAMGVPLEEIVEIEPSKRHAGGNIAWITSYGYKLYTETIKRWSGDDYSVSGDKTKGSIKIHYGGDDADEGSGTEDWIDFTRSARLEPDRLRPIRATVNLMKHKEAEGSIVGVITARKGETPLTSIEGRKVDSTNKRDIAAWLRKQGVKTITPENVYGAADYGTKNFPEIKAELLKTKFIDKYDPKTVSFFDDDIKNAKAVSNIKHDSADIYVYSTEFGKGELPRKPTFFNRRNESIKTFEDYEKVHN